MAANLKSRLVRLEQQNGGGGEPLIVKLSRFDAPHDVFSGVKVGTEFFGREPGESIDETERRVADILRTRRGASIFVMKPVALRACAYVAELPE
ncbi:hypothetical protein [Paraburkholderia caffeinilytica]|uniref:hypothetical protein n=1 Tax=Paraburkholderia caffeinilytica TaxID=1761016 RepID=UPI003D9FCD9B